ncbi:hypothetical protein TTHERM_00359170 (macronuclear) [Tetrahymena thermophila SB210]|uniref:Uncharacterized protein n=1 Tax=Tetrahymena thermophila (strain SB210) TaxID=312017 RepID=Q22PM9_TETTS|nr:hypothetical protein TTHERM_00359170 [Tetrahymena thermophila SB210]EAR87080.2 hypothetical protein TTHERM_00359170 [Tetrahymena thermophila SB210]|eukprot:XP_001007325.2 hypothetical protein TTHERM_00359170 [Tetrahymena thermophila SB210]
MLNKLKNSYNLLQDSYIKLCINLQKTHLDFVEFINLDELKKKLEVTNFSYRHAKVFDNQELRYKLLIIIQTIENTNAISYYQKITKTILRNDITLNLINQYYLDTEKIFYVFEMEYYDQSLENFEKQYLLNRQTINSLKQEIYTYFEGNLNLAHNFEDTGYGDYLEFYVMSLNQDKIQIKLNLISPFIEKQEIETNQNQDQQDDQQVDESENQNSNESENEIQIEDDDEDQNQVEEEEEENENESQIINESEVEEQEESEDQNQVEDENEVEEEENENENESQTENESEIEEQEQQESEIQIEIKEDDEDQNQVEDESEVEEQEKNEIQTEIKEENKLEIDGDNDIEDEDKNENNYCKKKNMQPGNQKQVKKNTSFEKIIDHLPLESQSNEFARKQQKYLDQIQDIINLVKMKIPKKDLSNVIQNTFSNILNFHPLEIFEIIQKHPNYKSFEVVESNESIFILKVNKGKQTILLEGYKACSVDYQLLIKNSIQITKINPENILIGNQYGSDSYEDNEISLNQDLQNAFIIDELSIQQFTTQYTEIYEFELHKHVVQNNNNERLFVNT